uniref:CCHC-type domain-containing protein n=1 Tax=Trichogramma kaykai TaxID=54128 RepID=A0ABD2XR35_9HYME
MCFNCGDEQHPNSTCKSPTTSCANCKTDPSIEPADTRHVNISSSCPKVQQQKKINTIMAFDNLSFMEARDLVIPKKTYCSSLNKTQENYPPMKFNNRPRIKADQSTKSFKPPYYNTNNNPTTYKDIAAASGIQESCQSNHNHDRPTVDNGPPKKNLQSQLALDPGLLLHSLNKNASLKSTTQKLHDRLQTKIQENISNSYDEYY